MQDGQSTLRDERRHPFFIVDNIVIDHYARQIGVNGLAVYAVLVRHAKDGTCFPSIPTIAKKLGIADNTVKGALKKLEAMGLLRITPQQEVKPSKNPVKGETLRHKSNLYTLLDPVVPGSGNDPPLGQEMTHTGSGNDPPLGQHLTPNNTKSNNTKEKEDEEDSTRSISEPSSPSSPVLAQEVQHAVNLYSKAMVALVDEYTPKLQAKGTSILTQAILWREKFPRGAASSFANWLRIALKDDIPRSSTAPPPERTHTRTVTYQHYEDAS